MSTEKSHIAFQLYMGVKLHFTHDNYNFDTYKGKGKSTRLEIFEARKDKYVFEKFSRKYDEDELIELYVSNFLYNPNSYSGNIKESVYTEWKKKIQAIEYNVKEEMEKIMEYLKENKIDFNGLFVAEDGAHPPLLQLLEQNEISMETFMVLEDRLGFFKEFDERIHETIIWPDIRKKAEKYFPFLLPKYHVDRVGNIIRKVIVNDE